MPNVYDVSRNSGYEQNNEQDNERSMTFVNQDEESRDQYKNKEREIQE